MRGGAVLSYIWTHRKAAIETESRVAPAVYLDYAATAPIEAAAVRAMTAAAAGWANPSSVHAPGRGAAAMLEEARAAVADALDCQPGAVIFTSGGTEAIGLALAGAGAASLLVGATEHDAVRRHGRQGAAIPVDAHGIIDLAALDRLLAAAPAPALVAVMHANNETGTVQPITEVLARVRAAGGRLLVDGIQTAGKLPLPPGDFVAVSAHKLGGPPGTGALVVRCLDRLAATGSGQERGYRAGTENLPGIAGFAAALQARAADAGWYARATALRDRLEAALDGAEIVGGDAARLGTISCIRMAGVPASTQVIALDLAGFAVSAGAACSSGKVRISHVLAAMGYGERAAGEAIRVSLGWRTTAAEIDAFATAWNALASRQRAKAA